MTYTYHLIYSCYNNSMQLLLNEKRISQNSSLCRFMGEPFGKWCRQMPGLLTRELGEKSCTVGDLFVLRCDYFPEDADNVDIISWASSNQEVAQVEAGGSGGWVTVNGIEKCEIICRAGEVSARCRLDCRPFPKMP